MTSADHLLASLRSLNFSHLAFSAPPPDDPGYAAVLGRSHARFELEPDALPVPSIAEAALIALGARNLGRFEKLAWEYVFLFESEVCSVAFQKFGLRFYTRGDLGPEEAKAKCDRFQRDFAKVTRLVERAVLAPITAELLERGDVTIQNRYHGLRRAYDYFRSGAALAYAGEGRMKPSLDGHALDWFPETGASEGWWNTHAMIVAYFSLLEHVLVTCLAFQRPGSAGTSLKSFLGLTWGKKFKEVFDVNATRNAKRVHDELLDIAEVYRNTFSHGGFDKGGATLNVQLPALGLTPMVLGGITRTPHFRLVPMSKVRYESLCATFDSVDAWLASEGGAPNAITWLVGGLDLRFDAAFLAELGRALGDDRFDSFIEKHARDQERAMNMDW